MTRATGDAFPPFQLYSVMDAVHCGDRFTKWLLVGPVWRFSQRCMFVVVVVFSPPPHPPPPHTSHPARRFPVAGQSLCQYMQPVSFSCVPLCQVDVNCPVCDWLLVVMLVLTQRALNV